MHGSGPFFISHIFRRMGADYDIYEVGNLYLGYEL